MKSMTNHELGLWTDLVLERMRCGQHLMHAITTADDFIHARRLRTVSAVQAQTKETL